MKYSKYRILIAYDFSEFSDSVLTTVLEMQKEAEFKISVVYVSDKENRDAKLGELQNRIKLKEKALNMRSSCQIEVLIGGIGASVVNYATKINASLIFITNSTQGDNRFQEIGINAKRILNYALCPVVVIKRDLKREKIRSLLLPIDLMKENRKKISSALFFASFFNGATIRLASVIHGSDDYNTNRLVYQLNHLLNFIRRAGYSVAGEIIRTSSEGDMEVGRTLVDYADKQEAEIILLMTDDEENTNSHKMYMGSEVMIARLQNNVISLNPGFTPHL
jgi:nucleotide-binding universal stress UspA family protein